MFSGYGFPYVLSYFREKCRILHIFRFMIKREHYLNQLIRNKQNGFPKVITGLRRSGKSFLLTDIYISYLKEHGVTDENILVVELDDDKSAKYRNPVLLGDYVRKYCKGKKDCFVFLDEIQLVNTIINPAFTDGKIVLAKNTDQNVISFVDVILGLSREKNIDLYVTGSNSKMLSSDIITQFRDKAVNIHIAPLSFEEFYAYRGGSATDAIYEYMQYGGMPLTVLKNSVDKRSYLRGLFDTTYFKDIIEHNHLKKSEALDELCNILSTCTGELINSEKIANTYQSIRHEQIDASTVTRYIGYFKDAYLINEAPRYDVKGRREIGAQRKYYFTDVGLRNARMNFAFPDEGQIIENIIYNELLYNGYTVNVGVYDSIEKDKNGNSIRKTYEINFYAVKDLRMYYIQAASDIFDPATHKREIKPYISLNDQIQKIIVINKPISETRDQDGFTIIGLTDFLLRFIK